MTPEQMLVLALSTPADLEQEKLAHALDQLSADDLEQIYRSEMSKEAYIGVDDVLGGLVGHHYGKEQKKRGEGYSFGVPQAAGVVLLPGGAGYQIGRYVAHHTDPGEKKARKEKKSAVADLSFDQKLALADQWGRELAYADLEKTAALPGFVGKGLVGLMKAGPGARAAVGAGVGAAGGAIAGGPDNRLQGALGGAALGAGAGLGAKPAVQALGGTRTGIGRGIRQSLRSGLDDAVKNAPKTRGKKNPFAGFENAPAAQAHREMTQAARGASAKQDWTKANPNWRQSATPAAAPAPAGKKVKAPAPAPAAPAPVRPEVQKATQGLRQQHAEKAVAARRAQADAEGAAAAAQAPVRKMRRTTPPDVTTVLQGQ